MAIDDKITHNIQQDADLEGEDVSAGGRQNQSYKSFDQGYKISDNLLTQELFERFKKKVFKARPNIANIQETYGHMTFYEYTKIHTLRNKNKIAKERRSEIAQTIGNEVKRLLGSAIAESVVRQLKDNSSASTIQHSAPFGHPYVMNSTLQNSLTYFNNTSPSFRNVLVMACAAVSFNNYKYPRGHLFHSFGNGTPALNQLPLFGHTADARPVIHHKPYDIEAITEIKNKLQALERSHEINREQHIQIQDMFDSIYASPHALSQSNYHDQLTVTNYWLFKNLFGSYKGAVPNLVFLSQEQITLRLLLEHHLHQETTIHKILFDPSYEKLLIKHFDGLNGAFSQEKNYGTYLFWGFPQQDKYRIQLWKKGDFLVASDDSYKVELTPQAITTAINNNELIPNTMLTFILLSFYYGLFLAGGPAQTLNLTKMKEAYTNMQQEAGDMESVEAAQDVITTNFALSRPTLPYIETKHDERIPATYIDLMLYADMKRWNSVLEATKKTTLDELLNRTLPSFYAEFVPGAEKEDAMNAITERDIEKFTGLDKKIPPLATL